MREEKGKPETEFAVEMCFLSLTGGERNVTTFTKICNTAFAYHTETHVEYDYMAIFIRQQAMKLKPV